MQTINQPAFMKLSKDERKSVIEALIFSSEEPLSSKQILNLLINIEFNVPNINTESDDYEGELKDIYLSDEPEFTENYFDNLIGEINTDLIESNRPYIIVQSGGGWQFGLMSQYGEMLHKYFKTKVKKKFSQAALETLAVIAYKQPVSKPEIEQIRGVNSNEVVNSLIEKKLIKIAGRSESLGKPLLYATTVEFLRTFSINSIDDLPKLKELEEIMPNNQENQEPDMIINIEKEQMMNPESNNVDENDNIEIDNYVQYFENYEKKSEFIE
ncbi:MAG: SMC-Scp complex subunit ScpB [Candidatus Kapabacteria bacterium]|nr:SMC-Scp complex subunit ScpB [Ignavibacteriota bacterium]MCW5884390.1 SMC-Scp complex subunit ScpB [Candidatus Kapabacteria bacterium]